MIDISPLVKAHEFEQNPEFKAILKLALDLLGSGYTSAFTKLYKRGAHRDVMSPKGILGFEKVIKQFIDEEEELGLVEGDVRTPSWSVVCALPAVGMIEGRMTPSKRKGKEKVVGKKWRPNLRPLSGRSGKVDSLRRIRGKGVKIYDLEENEAQAKVEFKVKEEVVDEDWMNDGEVEIINESLFNLLIQLADNEKDILSQL